MTPAERLRNLMILDTRPEKAKAAAAGMSKQEWSKYTNGRTVPGIDKAARILTAIDRTFADLDSVKEG